VAAATIQATPKATEKRLVQRFPNAPFWGHKEIQSEPTKSHYYRQQPSEMIAMVPPWTWLQPAWIDSRGRRAPRCTGRVPPGELGYSILIMRILQ
jgi:hypothetical protein